MTTVRFAGLFLAGIGVFSSLAAAAVDDAKTSITTEMQRKIDAFKDEVVKWGADPVLVKAVEEQNAKGPIAGMTEEKWKALKRRGDEIKAFESSPAGELLKQKLKDSGGKACEAFLNGAQGEKVAFAEKTSSYVHKGKAKFDVAFTTSKTWQGDPEFDESTQTYAMQVAIPILKTTVEGGKETKTTIGVLVVGVDLSKL
jgi:hypothetical protein